jgi:hypothetical protein
MRSLLVAFTLFAALLAGTAARAQPIPPDALAAGRELVAAAKMVDQIKTMFPALMQSLKPAIVQNRPEVERDFDAIMPMMIEGALARTAELADLIAAIYARNFSVAEMRDITAFYRTSTGQKLLEKLPAVMQQALAAGQQFAQTVVGDMQQRMIQELRKRGHNI